MIICETNLKQNYHHPVLRAVKRGLPGLTAADMKVISGTLVLKASRLFSKRQQFALDVDATSDNNRTTLI